MSAPPARSSAIRSTHSPQGRDTNVAALEVTPAPRSPVRGAWQQTSRAAAPTKPELASPETRPRHTVPPAAIHPTTDESPDAAIAKLAATANQAISTHVNANGLCAICRSQFPCPVACLAEANLAALSEPPARRTPRLPSRPVRPGPAARMRRPVGSCGDMAMLRRVLAGLNGLDD